MYADDTHSTFGTVGNRIMQIRFSLGHVIFKIRGPRGKKHGGDFVTNLWTQGGLIKSKEVTNSGYFLLVYRVNVPHTKVATLPGQNWTELE